MQDEQTDEAVEPTAEDTTTDAEGAADDAPSGEDADTAATVDQSASGGADAGVLEQPEVPSDANEKISAAQEHINSLDMDAEREAADRAAKNT